MNYLITILACLFFASGSLLSQNFQGGDVENRKRGSMTWPVLKEYDQQHLAEIALPLGGIGTGSVSIGGRGNLCDMSFTNKPRQGFLPRFTYFLLRCQKGTDAPVLRMLESEVQAPFEHHRGFDETGFSPYGLPRFREGAFRAAYPLGQVLLSSPEVPLKVRIEAFNPMIPGDAEASGVPIAIFRFVMQNPTSESINATILGSFANFIGDEYWQRFPARDRQDKVNHIRKSGDGDTALSGLYMEAPGVPADHSAFGTIALAVLGDVTDVRIHRSYIRPGIERVLSLEHLWRRFERYNDLEIPDQQLAEPVGALASGVDVPAGSERSITILLAWHFPNRLGWNPAESDKESDGRVTEGERNWYATQYHDAWDVLEKSARRLPALEAKTVDFVKAFTDSDVPKPIREAALFNASTLRTTTCFRMEDGNFFGYEGSRPGDGCGPGSCTHVWAYETATSFLYGELARSMRDVAFRYGTDETGRQSMRVTLPLTEATRNKTVAADGQMSAIIRFYHDWKLSGDREWLNELWPRVRAALKFAWTENGWDADQDGVMEGVQHNTSDLELFGPNPLMAGWYLTALRAAEEMANAVGDEAFAEKCGLLYHSGRAWVDENLYNGSHYIQIPRRPPSFEVVPRSSWLTLKEVPENKPLPQQINHGCQTDQLAGQLWAHLTGLGYILDSEHVRQTLQTIYQRNFKTMRDQNGFFRAFALNDERALVFGTYPENDIPEDPNFRFSEVWNGFEYTAAAHMIYEGQKEPALEVIKAIRDRYDGRKRNPFNEPEFGNHYARSMASWSCYLAWTGFGYNVLAGALQFRAVEKPSRLFWSNGYAWGVAELNPESSGMRMALTVMHGDIKIKSVEITGAGRWEADEIKTIGEGERLECQMSLITK